MGGLGLVLHLEAKGAAPGAFFLKGLLVFSSAVLLVQSFAFARVLMNKDLKRILPNLERKPFVGGLSLRLTLFGLCIIEWLAVSAR